MVEIEKRQEANEEGGKDVADLSVSSDFDDITVTLTDYCSWKNIEVSSVISSAVQQCHFSKYTTNSVVTFKASE